MSMGVYIKGMEMPRNEPLLIKLNPDGSVSTTAKNGYRKYAAVPVPPHVRLIDADEMKESVRKQTAFLRLMGGGLAEIAEMLEKGFLQEIDNAPTVIPVEKGET